MRYGRSTFLLYLNLKFNLSLKDSFLKKTSNIEGLLFFFELESILYILQFENLHKLRCSFLLSLSLKASFFLSMLSFEGLLTVFELEDHPEVPELVGFVFVAIDLEDLTVAHQDILVRITYTSRDPCQLFLEGLLPAP